MASIRSIRFLIPDGNKYYQRFVVNHATSSSLLFLHDASKVRSSVTQSLLNKRYSLFEEQLMKNQFAHTLFNSTGGYAALALRLPVGLILAAHGAQKLFGWFGGYGLEGTGQWMTSIGLEPGYAMALLAGSAEFLGGIALFLGLLTRPAAIVTAVTMLVAIFSVHLSNGLFLTNNGYEYALTLFAATTALAIQGAGRLSVDSLLQSQLFHGRQ
jgi:putative oxidoreductase